MTKKELHNQLSQGPCTIPEQVFLDIYGKDDSRPIEGHTYTRADILALVHGLKVSKDGTNYVFTESV